MLKLAARNWSVVRVLQNRQLFIAFGLARYPPAKEMYGSIYCAQVRPEGGFNVTNSMSAQLISCWPIASAV